MGRKLWAMMMGFAWLITVGPIASLSAHHSFAAEFDAQQPVTLNGTITKIEWINPHSWLHIDVQRPNGKKEAWMIEAGNVGGLIRMGWTRDSVPPGTKVVIEGYRAKDGSLKANGKNILLPDGRKLFLSPPALGAPQ